MFLHNDMISIWMSSFKRFIQTESRAHSGVLFLTVSMHWYKYSIIALLLDKQTLYATVLNNGVEWCHFTAVFLDIGYIWKNIQADN